MNLFDYLWGYHRGLAEGGNGEPQSTLRCYPLCKFWQHDTIELEGFVFPVFSKSTFSAEEVQKGYLAFVYSGQTGVVPLSQYNIDVFAEDDMVVWDSTATDPEKADILVSNGESSVSDGLVPYPCITAGLGLLGLYDSGALLFLILNAGP